MTVAAVSITEHWHELVTVALLGTDRREPSPAPPLLADVIDDALGDTAADRLLTAVAAAVVARRVGMRPGRGAAPLQTAPIDRRPVLPVAGARRWARVITEWPVLEDEYWVTVRRHGWRLPPDVLVGALRRHRRDAHRWADVMAIGGASAAWLVEHRPDLGRRESSADPGPGPERGLDGLVALAVAPELVGVLTAGEAVVVAATVELLESPGITMAHRNVLVNFVARCRADVLPGLALALRTDVGGPAGTLGMVLSELATARHTMLMELELTELELTESKP